METSETKKCGLVLGGTPCAMPAGHDGPCWTQRAIDRGYTDWGFPDYLHLCPPGRVEGQCDTCDANADRDRKAADYDRLAGEVERVTRERDTLVASLVKLFDWSDTSYLHAVLHVENAVLNLRADLATVTHERDEARALCAASDRVLASGVVVSTEKYADLVRLTAEARAETLATALREAHPVLDMLDTLVRRSEGVAGWHQNGAVATWGEFSEFSDVPGIETRVAEALDTTPPADLTSKEKCDDCDNYAGIRVCTCCWLKHTPPADLTQHPAYRAGVEAGKTQGLEAAAKVCDDERESWLDTNSYEDAKRGLGAESCAATIRALLEPKAVRDDE